MGAHMNNLRSVRRESKVTQSELAVLMGTTQAAISHYETGRRSPDLTTIRQFVSVFSAKGIKTSVDELFPDELSVIE